MNKFNKNIDINQQIQYQPSININMLGHVSNGKSSLTEKMTETKTQRFSSEQYRNITIKLGYANSKIFKCLSCEPPKCYQPFSSNKMTAYCKYCHKVMKLEKHISIVDSPGHNLLMQVMLNGTAVANSTIIVESVSNDIIPAPQTKEHLEAANILKLHNVMVCMNKMDLTDIYDGEKKIKILKKSLQNTIAQDSPIIPIVANFGINIDIVCEYICTNIPEPIKDLESKVKMIIIRSFNINKQNIPINEIKGGVVGGTIMKGILQVGTCVRILPGFIDKGKKSKWKYMPLISSVESINSEKNNLKYAIPGGLIGVQLSIDPCITVQDRIIGHILEEIYTENDKIIYDVYERIYINPEFKNIDNISIETIGKQVIINHNGCDIKCNVIRCQMHKKMNIYIIELELIDRPICAEINDYIAISKILSFGNSYMDGKDKTQLLGRAKIINGEKCEM